MRNVVWFSCGAPSAVAAWLAVRSLSNVWIVYCNVLNSEHEDNIRFMVDVHRWIQYPIVAIRSAKYASIVHVFDKERYMSGVGGARCTTEMKKVPRFKFQRWDDTHIFGLAHDEQRRIVTFENNNHELKLDWILRRNGLSTQDCHNIVENAGIRLPEMYRLGFKHNNCIGCVKATSPEYWQRVRIHFPDVFRARAEQSRQIGCKLVRISGQRMFLDEMPLSAEPADITEDISCGPHCEPTQ